MTPRFRFAPSPTGAPHIGNLHTALFSWGLARAMSGDFIIRIDDTDPERNTPEAVQAMFDALRWLGLDWDEGPDVGGAYGPYIQSHRFPRHQEVMALLVAEGHAYYGEEIGDWRLEITEGQGLPLRLRLPPGETVLHDALRGPITFDNATFKDPIIVRSDGRPLYHLATVADDHDMGITHVVRGDDWIATSPIHVQLYQALGWPEPVWVHLPLILNKQGEKLKKRDSEGGYLLTDFQDAGYLPEALFNYLLLLGWAPDNAQEIVSKWDARRQFRIERLSKSPAVFDWDKLNWVNRQYLQGYSDEALTELIRPFLEEAYGSMPMSQAWLVRLAAVIRNELVTLSDAVALAEWAFVDDVIYDEAAHAELSSEAARRVLVRLVAELAHLVILDGPTAQSILQNLRASFKASHDWKAPQIFHPIRAALIGKTSGPPLHEILDILGKDRAMVRLAKPLRET